MTVENSSMPTLEYAETHDVIGRSEELENIRSALASRSSSLVSITGESGVGKTAIANRVLEMANAGALTGRFMQTMVHSVYHESWGRVLSHLASAILPRDTVLKASERELEELLVEHCRLNDTLLVIDNLDPALHAPATSFLDIWAANVDGSAIIVTSVTPLSLEQTSIVHVDVGGLPSSTDQVELLGGQLRERFGDAVLVEAIRPLNGLPLDLLYIRWLDPQDEDALRRHTIGLAEGTLDKTASLVETLFSLAPSTTFFTALGIVRHLQFDESLLAYLWDSMGGGNTTAYIQRRERFLEARLLTVVPSRQRSTFRLSEEVHKHLYRSLVPTVGESRIPTFHFFLGEYYRARFENDDSPDIVSLEGFLHHTLERGDRLRAYEYVFDGDVLSRFHQAGMALQLRDTLQGFLELSADTQHALADGAASFAASADWTTPQKCHILLELAHVYSDLGDYAESLMLTMRVEALLTTNDADASAAHELRRQTWYYAAVAHSNIGRSEDSLRFYFRIFASAKDDDTFGCLALGYLAHCALKYHDLLSAQSIGIEAVAIAQTIGDTRVLTKNLCSVGETHIYAGELSAATACFEEAYDLIGGGGSHVTDRRELGRLLIHWGVLGIAEGDYAQARQRLERARAICLSVNDRRRVATNSMYLGILDFHTGEDSSARQLMAAAIGALHKQRDGRYLIPAIFTYWSWLASDLEGTVADLAGGGPPELIATMGGALAIEERYETYAAYWRQYFRPTLLRSQT